MLANDKSDRLPLTLGGRNSLLRCSWDSFAGPNKALISVAVPAMADSVLLLQVLLSGPAVNLRSVTEVIRADLGLTIELLRLASFEEDDCESLSASVSKNVVRLGIDTLLTLASTIEPLSSHPCGRVGLRNCEQFWGLARLTGLMAEELAQNSPTVDSEEAYVAGLLFNMGELPSILGWQCEPDSMTPDETFRFLAKVWGMPASIRDMAMGDDMSPSSPALDLLEIVRLADQQARRLQGLVGKFARGVF